MKFPEISHSDCLLTKVFWYCKLCRPMYGLLLYPATTHMLCYAPWYKSVYTIWFWCLLYAQPLHAALSSVYPVEATILLHNLGIIMRSSCRHAAILVHSLLTQYFLCSSQTYVMIARKDTWEKQLLCSVIRKVT